MQAGQLDLRLLSPGGGVAKLGLRLLCSLLQRLLGPEIERRAGWAGRGGEGQGKFVVWAVAAKLPGPCTSATLPRPGGAAFSPITRHAHA